MAFSKIVKLHQEQPTKLVLLSGLSLIKPQLPTKETLPEQWPLLTGSPLCGGYPIVLDTVD